jgi:hypothetical protein
MHFIKISILVLILFVTGGCNNKIKEDKFILVYSDLVIALDTMGANFNQDSVKKIIFKRYNISTKEYNETLNYYNSDPGKWEPFFNKTIAHLEGLKSKKGK